MCTIPFIVPAPIPPLAPGHPAATKPKTLAKRTLTTPKAPRQAKHTPASAAAATPTALEQEATRLGFPTTLFGLTPNEHSYWYEPGLPWLTQELWESPPVGYDGQKYIWCYGQMGGDHMAPRFPRGCTVNTAPVLEKKNLVVGRVYTYGFINEETGEREYHMGRLVKIGGNYLEVKADNNPVPSIWLLRDEEHKAVWDVREVTHYVSYPAMG